MFQGRKDELSVLEKRYQSDRFEFGFVYGQRRIGKTSLINEFGKTHKTLLFFATDSDDVSIRRDFSNQLFAFLDRPGLGGFENWESFFLAIKQLFAKEKIMIVFDEYPNIVVGRDGKKKNTDFDGKLQYAIDHIFQDTAISIVLMGSNVSFMKRVVEDGNGPLYKRQTFSLLIGKLRWGDTLAFVEGMSFDDKVKMLSLVDSFPYYLSQINPKLSFEENLDSFFFNRDSLITMDPTFALSSNINITGFYSGIMKCLSQGMNTIKEIAGALEAESGKVATYLEELIKAGAVSKSSYFNSKRSTYYEINDRMTAFFFRFVQPYVEHIKLGSGAQIKAREKDAILTFFHHAYEKFCIAYLTDQNNQGKLEKYYLGFANFRADNTSLGRSVEIDIVASEKDSLLLGECKYSAKKKGLQDYLDMKEDATIIPLSAFPKKSFYLFSHNGFDEDLLARKDPSLHLISSKDMMKK